MHTSHSRRVRARYTFLLLPITLIACGAEGSLVPPHPPPASPAQSQPVAAAAKDAGPVAPRPLTTDEGMWLFGDFPSDRLGKLHGFAPTQEWLDHVRESSVRIAGGCSGSFVSPNGLV